MQSRWLNVLGHVAWWQSKSGAVITNLLILTGIQSERFNILNCASCEHGCLATLQCRFMMHFGFLLVLHQQVYKHCACWCAVTVLIALTCLLFGQRCVTANLSELNHITHMLLDSWEPGDNHTKLNKLSLLSRGSIYLSTISRAFRFRLRMQREESRANCSYNHSWRCQFSSPSGWKRWELFLRFERPLHLMQHPAELSEWHCPTSHGHIPWAKGSTASEQLWDHPATTGALTVQGNSHLPNNTRFISCGFPISYFCRLVMIYWKLHFTLSKK